MKTINKSIVLFLSIVLFSFINLSAQEKSEKQIAEFKVYGNCGMCERRIEKALTVNGVESADWNKDTKIAKVVFSKDKITLKQLHKNVAAVGHDTEEVKASDEVYSKLPNCCKFERDSSKTETEHKMHDHN
jgi:copper chaperone CopZ